MSNNLGRSGTLAASLLLSISGFMFAGGPVYASGTNLSPTADPSYQTNGRVTSILTVGNTLVIGGTFTTVRPPGAPAGAQQVARAHLAAFRVDNGKLRAWNPSTDGAVSALAASPNGRTIFVGGDFSQLSGATRHRLGAVATDTGAVRHFRPSTNGPVLALAVTSSTVYLGGSFTQVSGTGRQRLAATDRHGRLLHRWKPRAGDTVRTLALTAGEGRVYIGGDFTQFNNRTAPHLAAVSGVNGAVQVWKRHPDYGVWDIIVKSHRVYLGGNGIGGRIAAFTPHGKRVWALQTDGGVQALTWVRGRVIAGGHFRNVCVGVNPGSPSGFQCPQNRAGRLRLLALGHRSGGLKAWNPGVNSGLGVFALTSSKAAFYAGGDFTKVDTARPNPFDQQGLARFPAS